MKVLNSLSKEILDLHHKIFPKKFKTHSIANILDCPEIRKE